jgi:hypothetical protein
MSHISLFRTSFVSLTLIAGVALAGCTDAAEPTDTTVGQPDTTALASGAQVQLAGSSASLTGQGWTQTAPGVFTNTASPGANSVVMGAQGHASAIATTQAKIADLRANGGAADAISQQEGYLRQLQIAASHIAADAISPRATCSIAIGTAPSSALVPGLVGIFAGAQLSCSVGTQVFTVVSQACTNLGCGPFNTQTTDAVGAAAELWGSIMSGTAGAACGGSVSVTPPGFSGPVTGTCG